MISDEQLIAWEAELVEQNRFHWHGEVKALIDEIWRLKTAYENEVIKSVKLEREADWLAEKCANLDDDLCGINANGYREFARRAVSHD